MSTNFFSSKPENLELIREQIQIRDQEIAIERFNAQKIFEKVNERVIGHDVLAARVASLIENNSYARGKSEPLASILVSGPTGTGKTEFAKALTNALFPNQKDLLLRIDCGNLGAGADSMATLIGAGAVYNRSTLGTLPEFLKRTPNGGVVLFDEIEKAIPQPDAPLAKVMLSLLDEGRVQSQFDNSVYTASEHVIVMTSNAKQAELAQVADRFLKDVNVASPSDLPDLTSFDEAVKSELEGVFTPEFLGRIKLVASVRKLRSGERMTVLEILLRELLKGYDIQIGEHDTSFAGLLVTGEEKFGQSNVRGARNWLDQVCKPSVIGFKKKMIAKGNLSDEYVVKLGWEDGRLTLDEFGKQA